MTTPIPSADTLESFHKELDEIRDDLMAKVGEEDARYIRRIVRVQRFLELGGRAVMVAGFYHWIWWLVGVVMLGCAKILDNMEIGHNVMHGQYDWMNDPHLNSRTFDWDNVCDGESWRRTHNFEHHTYTNIIGKDRDFGYDTLRLSDDVKWKDHYRFQSIRLVVLMLMFEWAVAYHELFGERIFIGKRHKEGKLPISHAQLIKDFFTKIRLAVFRDYIFFPAVVGLFLGWPMFFAILGGNFVANLIRNLWANIIIFCGHFTEEVHTFNEEECVNESRGQWYYRQILGSSNLEGSKLLHIMSGHLSRQVEHHLFPDMPSYRYGEAAERVRQVCARHNIPYNTGTLWDQYKTVVARVIKYSRPPKKTGEVANA